MYTYSVIKGYTAGSISIAGALKDIPLRQGIAFVLSAKAAAQAQASDRLRRTSESKSSASQQFYLLAFYSPSNQFGALALVDAEGTIQAGLELGASFPVSADELREFVSRQKRGFYAPDYKAEAAQAVGIREGFCYFRRGSVVPNWLLELKNRYPGVFYKPATSNLAQADLARAWAAAHDFMQENGYTILSLPRRIKADFRNNPRSKLRASLEAGGFFETEVLPSLFGGEDQAVALKPLDEAFWRGISARELADEKVQARLGELEGFLQTSLEELDTRAAQRFIDTQFQALPEATPALLDRLEAGQRSLREKISQVEDLRSSPEYRMRMFRRRFKNAVVKVAPQGYPKVLNRHLLMLYAVARGGEWVCPEPHQVFFEFHEAKAEKGTKEIPAVIPAGLRVPVSKVILDKSIWEKNINWLQVLRALERNPAAGFAFVRTGAAEIDLRKFLQDRHLRTELIMYTAKVGKKDGPKQDNLVLEFVVPEQELGNVLVYTGRVSVEAVAAWPNLGQFFEKVKGNSHFIRPARDIQSRMQRAKLTLSERQELNRILRRRAINRNVGMVTVPKSTFYFKWTGALPKLPAEITEEHLGTIKQTPN